MLLTGGQISAAISSAIVFIFTGALFLSGYILQQRTVRNIQAVLHPPPSPTPTSLVLPTTIPVSDRRQRVLASVPAEINWKRNAYVQIARRHEDVCSIVMMFAELTRSESPAQKAILYPAEWDDEFSHGNEAGKRIRTTARLLQKANKQYKVALYPIKAVEGTEDGEPQEMYPLAKLLTLTAFERVVSMLTTGLIVDAEMLDTIFGDFGDDPFVAVAGASGEQPEVVMLRPNMAAYNKAIRAIEVEDEMLHVVSSMELATKKPWLLSETTSLRGEPLTDGDGFNVTDWYDMAAYVRYTDKEILGPQFDVPADMMERARPTDPQARTVWDGLYDRFRVERMAICGLDTEPMPRLKAGE